MLLLFSCVVNLLLHEEGGERATLARIRNLPNGFLMGVARATLAADEAQGMCTCVLE